MGANLNMTDENITANTKMVNSNCGDPRLSYIMERLVQHLHDFARETRLSTDEWMAGIEFLTAVGKKCSDIRQEFILLSDTLGLSVLVDAMSHPKPDGATSGTLLGPFHTHDALDFENGESICSENKGETCIIVGTVKDLRGKPVKGASINIWETDSTGHYDTQYEDREGPDCRGIVYSDEEGNFFVKAIRPVSYPIPNDGPVGKMLEMLQRHPYRPAHIHFMINRPGYDELITALYIKGDKYETSDAVFGVKDELIIELSKVDKATAEKYGVEVGDWYVKKDFVIMTLEESTEVFQKTSEEALQKMDIKARVIDGLPIADLD